MLACSLALALALGACGGASEGAQDLGRIVGSGSSVAQPLIERWAHAMKPEGLGVTYSGVGSGRGVSRLQADAVDFAVSGQAMDEAQLDAAKRHGSPLQVPVALAAIAVTYNDPDLEAGLKLDAETIAEIYLGKITFWNDPAIARLNPGLVLPKSQIVVFHRADASAATAAFTRFLAENSDAWRRRVGSGETVKWPRGPGVAGDEGIAVKTKQNRGAIGYFGLSYALENPLCCGLEVHHAGLVTPAAVRDPAGEFALPSVDSTAAAAAGAEAIADLGPGLVDSPRAGAFPIVAPVFVLAYEDLCRAGKSRRTAASVAHFLDYALGDGQEELEKLDYAPLPDDLLTDSRAEAERLSCDGEPLQP
jgi:phosphate transport system substrate-binding protein